MSTGERLCVNLLALGVRRGGVLLVHSSLRALGMVPGGPSTIILGLLETLGEQGTLLMPALSYAQVTPQNPYFDQRCTPSNVGAIPEAFRAMGLAASWPGGSMASSFRRFTGWRARRRCPAGAWTHWPPPDRSW